MKKYLLDCLRESTAKVLGTILGADWENAATLDKTLSPFGGLQMKYYRNDNEDVFFRSIESKSGLSVLSVYDSELAYRVASRPIGFTAEFRRGFDYAPDAAELAAQVRALTGFWQNSLKLNLERPLLIKCVAAPVILEVAYEGSEITFNRDGQRRAQLKFRNLETNSEFKYALDNFTPEWAEVIPRQSRAKQFSLF